MKHIYCIFISLCTTLFIWSCKDSEEIAPASLTINKNELSFTGYKSTLAVKVDATLECRCFRILDHHKPGQLSRSK